MPVDIREIEPEEFEAAGTLIVDAYRVAHAEFGQTFDPENFDDLGDIEGRAGHSLVLVAVTEEGLAGCITYVNDPGSPLSEFEGPDEAGMRMLAVDPRFGGRGIGTTLVRACIRRAKDDAKERIIVHTIAWMARPQLMYQQLGFRRVPERDLNFPSLHLMAYVLDL